jgi:hypothetical protein
VWKIGNLRRRPSAQPIGHYTVPPIVRQPVRIILMRGGHSIALEAGLEKAHAGKAADKSAVFPSSDRKRDVYLRIVDDRVLQLKLLQDDINFILIFRIRLVVNLRR